jgi:hypothetical protein
MRALTLALGAAALAACSKPDAPPPAEPTPPPAPTVALGDATGTWNVTAMAETSDSVITTYVVTASADPAAWTLTLPGRAPMALRVSTSADSIITEVGPFESVLRKGVQVTTRSSMRLVDGKLVGTTVARYPGATGADSVLVMRTSGTKTP